MFWYHDSIGSMTPSKDCQRMQQPNVGTWTSGGCSENNGNPIPLMDKMQDWFLSFNRVWSPLQCNFDVSN